MLVGRNDEICTHEQAMITAEILGDQVELFETYEEFGHNEFWGANSVCFMDRLLGLLNTHETDGKDEDKPEEGTVFTTFDDECPVYQAMKEKEEIEGAINMVVGFFFSDFAELFQCFPESGSDTIINFRIFSHTF